MFFLMGGAFRSKKKRRFWDAARGVCTVTQVLPVTFIVEDVRKNTDLWE